MAFRASYRGVCAECEGPIEPGDEIMWATMYGNGKVMHLVCPDDDAQAVRPGEKPCPRCMAIHPGEC